MSGSASPLALALCITAVGASSFAVVACSTTTITPANTEPTPDGGSSGSSGGDDGGPLPSTAVRFVAVGDTGTGEPGQKAIASAIAAKCEKDGCDFVQLLGDNLYQSGATSVDDPIWQERFEKPYAAIDLDFYAVLGNHDYGADGAGTEFTKGQNEVDYTQKSKKWKMPSAHFHFTKLNVEMFELDTNLALFARATAQTSDVKGWVAASTAEWKIAVGHHPYKSNGPHGNAGTYDGLSTQPGNGGAVKSFLEGTICGKVDLYISGHDHSQQWLNENCMGTELAVSGAGANTTTLKGKNASLFESLDLGFLYIVIDGKKLTAEFIDETGKTAFTHVITKP